MPTTKPSEAEPRPKVSTSSEANARAEVEDCAPAEDKPVLSPEVREAFEKSWNRHESAYRYLGQ